MANKSYIPPGFLPSIEKIDDWVLGANSKLPQEVLCPDKDWRPYEPSVEVQRNMYMDSFSCVSFANCNALEIIHKKRYGEDINKADRFLSVMSGTVPGKGNSHTVVAETARKSGYVDEDKYPFTPEMSQTVFFTKPPIEVQDLGIKWTLENEYGYEKVDRVDFEKALKYSPLQVAVDSTTNKTSRYRRADHSVLLTHLSDKAYIFDSYLNRFREYEVDYPFGFALRFHYKQNIVLNIGNMKLELLRNKNNGKIFLKDFKGRLHHIETSPDYEELIGDLNIKNWIDMPESEIKKFQEGVSISSRKVAFLENLKDLINKLGSK